MSAHGLQDHDEVKLSPEAGAKKAGRRAKGSKKDGSVLLRGGDDDIPGLMCEGIDVSFDESLAQGERSVPPPA